MLLTIMQRRVGKLPYGKTHVAITSTHRFNCPATMAIETLEATSIGILGYSDWTMYHCPLQVHSAYTGQQSD
ncbi:hypothetical protein OUZ56_001186 [Daphnia magna]|uniref:Uncharacterized protein n=1 Tax=Daphnia magna TaxID=35525 RepID=A0ABR0A1W9_9CRUS|nr:hypothetical protein OUZ56_001186 [Daphnia magna]